MIDRFQLEFSLSQDAPIEGLWVGQGADANFPLGLLLVIQR